MKKLLVHLVSACLVLFSFASCLPPSKEQSFAKKRHTSIEINDFSENEQENDESSLDSYMPPLNCWDTSDIDLSEIDRSRKLIAFSFDDTPSRYLENILAVFAAFNENNPSAKASATFFVNGNLLDKSSTHLLHAACALGCELGNHTQTHKDLTTLSKTELLDEIRQTDGLLQKIDQKPRHLLRAPFGRVNELVKSVAEAPLIDWSIDTLDWTGRSEDAIYQEVFDNRFSGAIVLMHDGHMHTVSALKRLLPDLEADGYQVVSVSKLIKAHDQTFRNGSVYIRARKKA